MTATAQGQLALDDSEPWPGEGAWRQVLPNGSVAVVEPRGRECSIVSREIDGVCVWGQVFSCSNFDDDHRHRDQVRRVLDAMRATPSDFCRWYFDEWVGR